MTKVHEEQVRRLIDTISEDEEKTEWIHPWAYSFLPADVQGHTEIYMLGFCKNCRKGVTVLVSRSDVVGEAVLTQTDLPRFGCVAAPNSF